MSSVKTVTRAQFLIVYGIGAVVYVWLLSRTWIGRDQIQLLDLGESLVQTGVLLPAGKGMSGGGVIPGSLLQILIGLPLMLWHDFRAPIVLLGVMNLLSAFPLYAAFRKLLDDRTALICFAIFWLGPWHLYHAAVLWEPAYLFLPATAHLWCSAKLHEAKQFWPSVILGILLLTTPQLHGSFLFLWLLTALLVYRRLILPDLRGLIAGAIMGALTLIPLCIAAAQGTLPSSLPSEGFIGKGLVYVYPLLKGLLYWIRLPSLDIGVPLKEVVYLESDWAHTGIQHAGVILIRILQFISVATIALSLLAHWWYYLRRRHGERSFTWIERYAFYAAVALIVAAGLAPITLQGWHVTVALHAAVIPFGLWASHRIQRRTAFRWALIAYLAIGVSIMIVIGLGKPIFRQDSRPQELDHYPRVVPLLYSTGTAK